ncbi:MAG: hypothetical protein KC474_08900 [Cyanobacteria bacterium HKST-UBA04]|nr:hypothetical protein [Cyanobacteria bacterium HKST-UBA04]
MIPALTPVLAQSRQPYPRQLDSRQAAAPPAPLRHCPTPGFGELYELRTRNGPLKTPPTQDQMDAIGTVVRNSVNGHVVPADELIATVVFRHNETFYCLSKVDALNFYRKLLDIWEHQGNRQLLGHMNQHPDDISLCPAFTALLVRLYSQAPKPLILQTIAHTMESVVPRPLVVQA